MSAWFTNTVKRWPAATFCVLVYGLVWLLFLAFRGSATPTVALLIGSWLPNLVGLLVTAVAEGWPGVRRLLGRFTLWRVGVKWYAAALVLPATTVLLAIGLHVLAGNPAPTAIPANALLPAALFNLILGPLGEELGWRGTLLPRLRTRQGVLTAGLLVGLDLGAVPPAGVAHPRLAASGGVRSWPFCSRRSRSASSWHGCSTAPAGACCSPAWRTGRSTSPGLPAASTVFPPFCGCGRASGGCWWRQLPSTFGGWKPQQCPQSQPAQARFSRRWRLCSGCRDFEAPRRFQRGAP